MYTQLEANKLRTCYNITDQYRKGATITHDYPGSDQLDGKTRDIKKITQSAKKLDTGLSAKSESVDRSGPADNNNNEIVLPNINTYSVTNLKTEADHDDVTMQNQPHDSIDNLLDSTTRNKYSKSYSEMPKDFIPHQRKKGVNMPERVECNELKEM